MRRVEANQASPYYGDLRSLLMTAFGPAHLLWDRLTGMEGVEQAFIYGSWAATERGELAAQPRDIDLMVIGRPDLDRLYEVVGEVERQVGRAVNLTVLNTGEWDEARSGFLRSVRDGPRIMVA